MALYRKLLFIFTTGYTVYLYFNRQAEKIIPRIFQFLVNLSYSKQHSKSIIDIPKIIQLCDGLMASGQDPRTHCIPALEPIVEDVFLFRSRFV